MSATSKRDFSMEELVLLLRAKCPSFNNNVAGLSVFSNVTLPSLNIETPYLAVSKVSGSGEAYNKVSSSQPRIATISFVVCVDNSRQKGSGAGKDAVKVVDSVNPLVGELEAAILGWRPVTIVLSDTPLYIDEGTLGSDNAKLWYEVVWSFGYTVFNPAFKGLAQGPDWLDSEEETPIPFTELALIYSQNPIPIFKDEWIYGPQLKPPALLSTAIAYEWKRVASIYDQNLKLTKYEKIPEFPKQTRAFFATTQLPSVNSLRAALEDIDYDVPPLPDYGTALVYTNDHLLTLTYNSALIQVPIQYADNQ